jgi:hypothetical protein|tara:strand:- start:905 stop:1765 length:861 start_codon:yes stop_codon:yes gene_type:complete
MRYPSKTAAARAIVDKDPSITADSFAEAAKAYNPVPCRNSFYSAAREWRERHGLGNLPRALGGPPAPVNHGMGEKEHDCESDDASWLLRNLSESRRSRAAKRAFVADLARKTERTSKSIHKEIVARFGTGIDHCTVNLIVRQVRFGGNTSATTRPGTLKFGLTDLEMDLVNSGKSLVNQMNRPGSRFNKSSCLVYVHRDVIDQLLNYKRGSHTEPPRTEPHRREMSKNSRKAVGKEPSDLKALAELVWEWMDKNNCKAVTFSEDGSVRVEDKPVVTRSFSLVKEEA